MQIQKNNYAFIDGANLHKGVKSDNWELDYKRFRVWLKEKHGVEKAYIFIGLVSKHTTLYTRLQEMGYILIFKETTYSNDGTIKGNCDADLVLHAVKSVYESIFDEIVLVSSDGDYSSLVSFLQEKGKMNCVVSPNRHCSILLKRTNVRITYLQDIKLLLMKKEKAPNKDGTSSGSIS